jgi:hypothetical protein
MAAARKLLQIQRPVKTIGDNRGREKRDIAEPLHKEGSKGAANGGCVRIVMGEQGHQPTDQLPEDQQDEQISACYHAEEHEGGECQ